MIDFLLQVLWETWNITKQASVFLLFGFLVAGVLAVLVPEKMLAKLFRTGKVKSVLWASAVGAPLPLCSCGVVPAALALRKQGATPGATVAFLISTPETGADSVSLSYALMDPIVTVFRPVAAVVTAITAGIATNFLGMRGKHTPDVAPQSVASAADACCAPDGGHEHEHAHHHSHSPEQPQLPTGRAARIRHSAARVYHYAFRQLLDDTSYWVVLGIVLSGIVAAALPASFFEQYLNNELAAMLLMLAIGIPLYVCASEATPLAAALVLKGLNPGAALVFLLAGPATNVGTVVLLTKFLGVRIVAIYLTSIATVAVASGYALNWVYRTWDIDPRATFGAATAFIPEPVKLAAALTLIILLVLSMRRTRVPDEWMWLRDRLARWTGLRLTLRRIALGTAVGTAVLYVCSGLIAIEPGEAGLRLRFGQVVPPELGPGLHYRLPWPFETHRVVEKERIQRIEFGFPNSPSKTTIVRIKGSERTVAGWTPAPDASPTTAAPWFQKDAAPDEPFLLTGDGNLIDLRWAVQYRVKSAADFAFNLAEPEAFVRGVSLASLRDVVARRSIEAIYTSERSAVESEVSQAVQTVLDQAHTGVEILSFHLLYVHPPSEVHDAFRDVASAQEDKLRTINRAHIFAVESVNHAKGEAAAMMEQALAFREQQILHAQGDAASFLLRLGAYQGAPELTRFRLQVETLEETLPGLQKFVRPGAGEMKDFDMWLLQPVGASRSK